jgi:hypothetical protein
MEKYPILEIEIYVNRHYPNTGVSFGFLFYPDREV